MRLDKINIKAKIASSRKLTKKATKRTFSFYRRGRKLLLYLAQYLIDKRNNSDDQKYEEAALHLINKLFQHGESVKLLVETGLYGDAMTIMRSVISSMNMLYYLHYQPKFIDDFLKETKDSYQENSSFKSKFNESEINKCLVRHDMPSGQEAFNLMSKGTHASAYGGQLFCSVHGNNAHMKYAPGFEASKLAAFTSILVAFHWDIVTIMLWHRHSNSLSLAEKEWRSIIRRQGALGRRVKPLSDAAMMLFYVFSDKEGR